jgi:hypothetical protein
LPAGVRPPVQAEIVPSSVAKMKDAANFVPGTRNAEEGFHTMPVGADVGRAVERLTPRERRDDAAVSEAARLAVRRGLKAWNGKRPVTDVHVVRV